jgi:hypothetical protein
MYFIQLSDAGAFTRGFTAPAITIGDVFTSLAEVTGDADCDRPLTICSDG